MRHRLDLDQRGFLKSFPEHVVGLDQDPAEDARLTVTYGGAEQTLAGLEPAFDRLGDFEPTRDFAQRYRSILALRKVSKGVHGERGGFRNLESTRHFCTPTFDMSRVSEPDGTVLDRGQGYLDHIQAIQYCNAEIRVQFQKSGGTVGGMTKTMVADTVSGTSLAW
jgi:hypothetical protein